MQQFTVPQFIDVEDKIIGPITVRQFIIMLASFLLIGISYKLFDFSLFLVVGIFIFIVSIVFSFVKINGRPFHLFVLNFIQTFKKTRLRVWNHTLSKVQEGLKEESVEVVIKKTFFQPRYFPQSRLAELSLIVDTQGAYKGEEGERKVKIRSDLGNENEKLEMPRLTRQANS